MATGSSARRKNSLKGSTAASKRRSTKKGSGKVSVNSKGYVVAGDFPY